MSALARSIPAIIATLSVLLPLASPAAADASEKVPMAEFCAGCHQPEPGVMMGFLDSISTIGQFIQMDFITHKDLVMYTDETEIKNVASFDEIDKYRRKGFKIRYEERDGQKWATAIARFDILETVAEDEKLTKETFKERLADEAVIVYGDGEKTAARRIADWGYRAVRVLPIDLSEWPAGVPVETGPMPTQIAYTPRPKPGTVTIEECSAVAEAPPADRMLVDVRNPDEVAGGALRHAVNIPTDQLRHRLDDLPPDREPVFFCRNGVRAEMAYYVVTNAGRKGHYLDASIRIDPDGRFRFAANDHGASRAIPDDEMPSRP